jgi:hypothetical protein
MERQTLTDRLRVTHRIGPLHTLNGNPPEPQANEQRGGLLRGSGQFLKHRQRHPRQIVPQHVCVRQRQRRGAKTVAPLPFFYELVFLQNHQYPQHRGFGQLTGPPQIRQANGPARLFQDGQKVE